MPIRAFRTSEPLTGIAIAENGTVWLASREERRLTRVTFEGGEAATSFESERVDAVALDPAGQPFATNPVSDGVAGYEVVGSQAVSFDNFGGPGSESGEFAFTTQAGLAISAGDSAWVADPGNNRIQHWQLPISAPSLTAKPEVAGETVVGRTVTASTGAWANAPVAYRYQWEQCGGSEECSAILGARSAEYVIAASALVKRLRVTVTASNSAGVAEATSTQTATVTAAVAPTNTVPPALSGSAAAGATLTASTGAWSGTPATYTHQWESCNPEGHACAPIEAAVETTYTLGDGDIGSTVRVAVSATNAAGSTTAYSAATTLVGPEEPSELEPPTIRGTTRANEQLEANAGAWSGTERTFSYQWESCNPEGHECAPIEGATEGQYGLGAGDIGSTVRLRVQLSTRTATLTDVSAPSAVVSAAGAVANEQAPTVSGEARTGQTLTANAGEWAGSPTSYSYQWRTCDAFGDNCENIAGATAATYIVPAEAAGHALAVNVTATSASSSASRSSAPTQPASPTGAPGLEAPPTATGTPLVGNALTGRPGKWSERQNSNISGAAAAKRHAPRSQGPRVRPTRQAQKTSRANYGCSSRQSAQRPRQ